MVPQTLTDTEKRVNVAEDFGDQLKRIAGEDTLVYGLTDQLRSGDPDFLDKMIAATYATMAFECIRDRAQGRMMAIRNGCYTDTKIPDPHLGARKVDVQTMYNIERYRPNHSSKINLPLFLTRA